MRASSSTTRICGFGTVTLLQAQCRFWIAVISGFRRIERIVMGNIPHNAEFLGGGGGRAEPWRGLALRMPRGAIVHASAGLSTYRTEPGFTKGMNAMNRIPVFFATTEGHPAHCRDDCIGLAGTGISERVVSMARVRRPSVALCRQLSMPVSLARRCTAVAISRAPRLCPTPKGDSSTHGRLVFPPV